MRIGIDASWAEWAPSGTATYTRNLVRALLAMDRPEEFVIYVYDEAHYERLVQGIPVRGARCRAVRAPLTNLRNQLLAYYLRRDGVDVFHSPAFFLPYLWRGRSVVTVHDVNFLRLGKEWWRRGTRLKYLGFRLQTGLCARLATEVVTISNYVAQDIVQHLHVPARRVHTVYHGVEVAPLPDAAHQEAVLRRYGLEDYILTLGSLRPHKNLARAIEAFARLRRQLGERAAGLQLALVGAPAGDYGDAVLKPLVRTLGLERYVVFTGPVADGDLPALYAGARVLFFPSFAEGFGLPVVEAMAYGCPVVAADATSLPEVAGGAALLVPPEDVAGFAQALADVLQSAELRADLVCRGRQRAAQFTWQRAAMETLAIYRLAARVDGMGRDCPGGVVYEDRDDRFARHSR